MLATCEKKVEVHVLRLPTSIFFEESDGLDGDMNEARPRAGSLRSNSEREYYSSNPASLLSPSIPIASIAEGTATARTAPGAEVLSRSEHSLKTLRRNGSSSSLASASDDGAADSNRRTAGGDFVIEIPQAKVGKDERGEFGETRRIEEGGMSGGAVEDHSHRHRSNSGAASFGGVSLPPSQPQPRKPTLLTRLTSTTSIASSLNSPEATRQSVLPLSPASELHLGGSFAERRPVVAASLKAFALFLLSLAVLSALLHTMLPPIHRDDWQKLKLPKNIDDLKTLNSVLQIYKDRHYWRVMGSFTTIYLLYVACLRKRDHAADEFPSSPSPYFLQFRPSITPRISTTQPASIFDTRIDVSEYPGGSDVRSLDRIAARLFLRRDGSGIMLPNIDGARSGIVVEFGQVE